MRVGLQETNNFFRPYVFIHSFNHLLIHFFTYLFIHFCIFIIHSFHYLLHFLSFYLLIYSFTHIYFSFHFFVYLYHLSIYGFLNLFFLSLLSFLGEETCNLKSGTKTNVRSQYKVTRLSHGIRLVGFNLSVRLIGEEPRFCFDLERLMRNSFPQSICIVGHNLGYS